MTKTRKRTDPLYQAAGATGRSGEAGGSISVD